MWFFLVSAAFALYTHLYYKTIDEAERGFSAFLLLVYSVAVALLCNGGGGEYHSSTAFVVPLFFSSTAAGLAGVVLLKRSYQSIISYLVLVLAIGAAAGVSLIADRKNMILISTSAVIGVLYYVWALFEL